MVPLLRKESVFGAACLAAVLAACAGQVPPGGGPRDTVPPAVVRTSPDTNATRILPKSITLEFSKYVDRRSVEESIFVSPYLGDLTYDWSGKEVTFAYSEQLKAGTTYVVSLGTDVAERNEGIKMASSFALAFSTGDSIDRGVISGRIFDEKPDGVMIFAYRLGGILPDTLDPSHVKPDYITQSGKNGTFSLVHLAFGSYRVFAVRDEYHNFLYDRQVDQYGTAPGDILISSALPAVRDLWYRLSREDTTRPFVAGVKPVNRRRLTVRFSEPVDSASFASGTFRVVDTLSLREVPLALAYLDRSKPSVAGIITAVPLDSPAVYRLSVRGVADLAGNLIDDRRPGETFEGMLASDTVRPSVAVRDMRDSLRSVPLNPVIEVGFSVPVVPFSLGGAVLLLDSTKSALPARTSWTGPASFALTPALPLASRAWYSLRVVMDSVKSFSTGRGFRDSTYSLRFQTLDLRLTGGITGNIEDLAGGKGLVVLTVSSVDLRPPHASTVRMGSPGPFSLMQLPEGKYMISAYRASAGGEFDYGLPAPFRVSDRFTVYPDTIRVRARWGVEGVTVKFR